MPAATLTADGSIHIPTVLREELGLRAGDRVALEKDPRGLVIRLPPEREAGLGRIPGLLKHRVQAKPVSVEEMRQAVLDEAADRDRLARSR